MSDSGSSLSGSSGASSQKPIKLVVVGDGATGKTSLLVSYAFNRFPEGYVPTVFDDYVVSVDIGGENIKLTLSDTAGQEGYERLRPLSYVNASIFLVCFSRTNRSSLENVQSMWWPEVSHYLPDAPILLVGTKEDLLKDEATLAALKEKGEKPISVDEANKMCKKIKAAKFVSCSALTRSHLKDTFDEAIKLALNIFDAPRSEKPRCLLF
eukprot:TRINITY_DN25792_c0_g1_i1.p1 TRINITY_DN25792_c0_g1~~TRINITY_DN25792_c0_g1_i1.p1  ORF type:complete len:210 (-),score=34.60 TRINITY_DN25792_c0_g1_i1:249-878(-)